MRGMIGAAMVAMCIGLSSLSAQAQEPQNRMGVCSAEWKAHKDVNGKPEKGTGRAAWGAFLKECMTRHPKPSKKTVERAA